MPVKAGPTLWAAGLFDELRVDQLAQLSVITVLDFVRYADAAPRGLAEYLGMDQAAFEVVRQQAFDVLPLGLQLAVQDARGTPPTPGLVV